MTITYSEKISYLLLRWKGSVFKAVWKQMIIWLGAWYLTYFVINYALNEEQRKTAANVVATFDKFCDQLPLVFILGFYVGQVVTRWWGQVNCVAWPDDIIAVANSCLYDGDHLKAIREAVARWVVLSEAMVFRRISSRIRKRFPKLENLVEAGLMTKQELDIIRKNKCKNTRWQMPLDWIIDQVIFPGNIDNIIKVAFVGAVNTFRKSMRDLFIYDWINIPLVYAQTVAIVVYGYFTFGILGHQYLGKPVDLYVPFEYILKFIFYVGWLDVARDLMHPFGEDDDDIELNCILDRHAAVAFSMATEVRETSPDIVYDEKLRQEMGEKLSNCLTYSIAATRIADHPPKMRAFVNLDNENEKTQVPLKQGNGGAKSCFGKLVKTFAPPNFF